MSSSNIKFIASVKDDSVDKINSIANQLKKLGCRIDSILTFSGVITGSTGSNISLDDLMDVDGIKNVERDRTVKAI